MHRRLLWFLVIASVSGAIGVWPFAHAAEKTERNPAFAASFAKAEKAFAQGDYAQAINGYQAALVAVPEHVKALFRLGQSLGFTGRPADAYVQFQRVLDQQPANVKARVELARCLVKMGDREEATRHLQWILKVQPDHAEAKKLLTAARNAPVKSPAGATAQAAAPDSMSGQDDEVSAGAGNGSGNEAAAGSGFIPMKKHKPIGAAGIKAMEAQAGAYQPWKNGEKAPARAVEIKTAMPAPSANVQGWRVSDFLAQASGSLGISIEYAKYCLEKGDLKKAHEMVTMAENLAEMNPNQGRMLEIQIHKALLTLYEADVRQFGQTLMRLKPVLSKQTLTNFLDVYNKADAAKTPVDVARIVGGVALGAEHFAVATRILGEVAAASPQDAFALRLLGEAQLENRDFGAAEQTFLRLASLAPDDAENNFNLARFYLTGKFNLARARGYANKALQLNPADARARILIGAVDYFEGRGQDAIAGLKKVMGSLTDQRLKLIAQRILTDCQNPGPDPEAERQAFARELALPGSEKAPIEGMTALGEDYLRRGSFFSALKCFLESRNLAEIGRVYLALASNLATVGDQQGAGIAAGFGMNALAAELNRSPDNAKAHLYLALYYFERKDLVSSRRHIEAGLMGQEAPPDTRRQLQALRSQLG